MKYTVTYLRPSEHERAYTFGYRDRQDNNIAMSLCEGGGLVKLCIETTACDGSPDSLNISSSDLLGLRAVFGKMVYQITQRKFVFETDIFEEIPVGSGLEFKLSREERCRSARRR